MAKFKTMIMQKKKKRNTKIFFSSIKSSHPRLKSNFLDKWSALHSGAQMNKSFKESSMVVTCIGRHILLQKIDVDSFKNFPLKIFEKITKKFQFSIIK